MRNPEPGKLRIVVIAFDRAVSSEFYYPVQGFISPHYDQAECQQSGWG